MPDCALGSIAVTVVAANTSINSARFLETAAAIPPFLFQALGDKAMEMVAEQLGSVIKGRRLEHDASVERLAKAHARGKEVKPKEAAPGLKRTRQVSQERRPRYYNALIFFICMLSMQEVEVEYLYVASVARFSGGYKKSNISK